MFSYIQLHSREFHKHFLSLLSHHQTEGMKQEGNVDEYANILHCTIMCNLALYMRNIFTEKKLVANGGNGSNFFKGSSPLLFLARCGGYSSHQNYLLSFLLRFLLHVFIYLCL